MDVPDLDKLKQLAEEHPEVVDKGLDRVEQLGKDRGGIEGTIIDKVADSLRDALIDEPDPRRGGRRQAQHPRPGHAPGKGGRRR